MNSSSRETEWKRWLQCVWPLGQAASMAILLEASAPKAGNVSPYCAFRDMDYNDFLASSLSIAPVFDQAERLSVGQLVHQAVQATQQRVGLNTNLGTLLLLAPLAKAAAGIRACAATPSDQAFSQHIGRVLDGLDSDDAVAVYAAIRAARPGGLGNRQQHDVRAPAPARLIDAMTEVAEVDAVARQYVNGFADVLGRLLVWLKRGLQRGARISDLVCEVQLRWLSTEFDGLIVRKAGAEIAAEAQQLAVWALDEWLETNQRGLRWQALDSFLRSDGHTRNPGTTADLIAAALFVLLIDSTSSPIDEAR